MKKRSLLILPLLVMLASCGSVATNIPTGFNESAFDALTNNVGTPLKQLSFGEGENYVSKLFTQVGTNTKKSKSIKIRSSF